MIPERIRAFLRTTIKSVWALDVLVLMKNAPEQGWTIATLNDDLRATPSLVEEIVNGFVRNNLVVVNPDGTFSYAPAAAETDVIASELVRLYAERPVAIIKEILSAPNEKIHSFVDAFRLKKD